MPSRFDRLDHPAVALPAAVAPRLGVVLLALVAAWTAAAGFLTAADIVLNGQARDLPLAELIPSDFAFVSGLMAMCLLAPALALIALSEFFGLRSAWYCAAGGVCAPAAYLLGSGHAYPYLGHLLPTAEGALYLAQSAAAGISAGLVYWRIAGRNARGWRSATGKRDVVVVLGVCVLVVLAVLTAPGVAGTYAMLFPPDTDAAWGSKVGWRLCNDAIAAWPKKPAPACWKLTLCDNEGGLAAPERQRLQQMLAETKCED
jgi:hypothetical protein